MKVFLKYLQSSNSRDDFFCGSIPQQIGPAGRRYEYAWPVVLDCPSQRIFSSCPDATTNCHAITAPSSVTCIDSLCSSLCSGSLILGLHRRRCIHSWQKSRSWRSQREASIHLQLLPRTNLSLSDSWKINH